jgi:hypothetical protein
MATFEIKQVHVPLFGVFDSPDKASWYAKFSSSTELTQVQVDPSALDMIADDLGLDAEGLIGMLNVTSEGNIGPKQAVWAVQLWVISERF